MENTFFLLNFSGKWKGDYYLETMRGETVGVYPIEVVYGWREERLIGVTALKLPNEEIQYENSRIWADGNLYVNETQSGSKTIRYLGWTAHQQLWWTNPLPSRSDVTSFQLHKEWIRSTEAGKVLTIRGHQWDLQSHQYLRIRADLKPLPPEGSFEFIRK